MCYSETDEHVETRYPVPVAYGYVITLKYSVQAQPNTSLAYDTHVRSFLSRYLTMIGIETSRTLNLSV